MKILALEFSSAKRSVAVGDGAGVQAFIESNQPGAGLALIDEALRTARLVPSDIGVIAIGLGPGSYAGIRSAIALGQGWQLARETHLLGISSVDVLARDALKTGLSGEVVLVIDAQRRELYQARYAISPNAVDQLSALEIVPISALDPSSRIAGPGAAGIISGTTDLYPTASTLLTMAAGRSDFTPGEQLEPIYLRETTFLKAPPSRFS